MLIFALAVMVIWVFAFALCRAAGEADRCREDMERRRHEDAPEA